MSVLRKIGRVAFNSVRLLGCSSYKNLMGISCSTRIEVSSKGTLLVGKKFRTRQNVEINVRDSAEITIGNGVFLNSGCIITARSGVTIGNNTIFGPNVLVYDNDHAKKEGKICDNEYITESITIGSNVWIGAGTIILKGSVINDNCIIAAGSIVKGVVEKGSVLVQKRQSTILPLRQEEDFDN